VDMSFEINWDKLTEDNEINDAIKEFLDSQFKSIELPSYIADLSVTAFSLGDTPPEVIIRHIGDPLESFYEEDGQFTPAKPPVNTYHSSDDEDDDSVDITGPHDDGGLSMIAEVSHINAASVANPQPFVKPLSPRPSGPSSLNRSRTSSDSVLMLIGSPGLNYLQNYNMNNMVGFVKQEGDSCSRNNSYANLNGRDTPLDILKSTDYKLKISKQQATNRSENDIQFIVEINYFGNLQLDVTVNLLVNYPSPNFISLPIKLRITDLVIHSIAAIAYLKNGVYFSFLCDVDDTNSEFFTGNGEGSSSTGGNFVDYINGPNMRERIDIIKKIKIESEIGEVENNILRNVGKVERFLTEQLRKILRDEIAWPSWVCFDLNDEELDDAEI